MVFHDCCIALPPSAIGLSAVCDCGISWSNSLTGFAELADGSYLTVGQESRFTIEMNSKQRYF